MKHIIGLALALLLPATAGAAAQPLTLTVDGVERHALVFAPSKATAVAAPTVFVFHGAGDSAANFSGVGFQNAWPEALVVYMDGLGRVPGQGGAFQTTDASGNNRDLKFFDAALADLHAKFRIDDSRVYATGFSNGAKFVYLLWATRPKLFAAFAPVAGMLTASVPFTEPKPLFHIGGREDHQNEFALQMKSVEAGRAVNQATKTPVATYIHDGGHLWPSDATARIVEFLKKIRRV